MTNEFKGKVVVVTGAAGVYGQQFAKRFANLGATLFLTDGQRGALETFAGELSSGAKVETFAADLTAAEELDALCDAVTTRVGPPDVVILNAGIYPFGGLFD